MLTILALAFLQRPAPPPADLDTDHDGLSDFQELHKYLTDPRKPDTDNDGLPDSDWDERRECTYTVRVVMHVLPPCDPPTMNDDYQDARILESRPDAIEFEAILYPFNTNAESLSDSKDERPPASLRPYLDATLASNWDEPLRKQLLAELAQQGIDAARLARKELVVAASKHLMQRSTFEDGFTVFDVITENGRMRVHPELVATVERELARVGRTLEQQWDRELFGRGMFESKIHGSCTSCAIYLQTGLRALGIPTRTIVCTPAIDANDEREVAWLEKRVTHHAVRRVLEHAASAQKNSWTSHTFNEVWLGGRWRRLNYDNLGQNILDPSGLGLMVHVHTYRDHSEAGLAPWGLHSAFTPSDGLFAGPNPYSCLSISDHFGAHCTLDNPAPSELKTLTIASSYWFGDATIEGSVKMKLNADDEHAGHLIVRIAEGREGDELEPFAEFYKRAPKNFLLRHDTDEPIHAEARRGYWFDLRHGVKDFYLRIPPEEFERMQPHTPYDLIAPPPHDGFTWSIAPNLKITR